MEAHNSQRALQHLLAYLRRLRNTGVDRVWLDDRALADLKALPTGFAARPQRKPAPSPEATGGARSEGVCGEEPPRASLPVVNRSGQKPALQVAPVAAADRHIEAEGATKAEKIAYLADLLARTPEVTGMETLRDAQVFSTGTPDADLMLIGEAPGYDEERLGEPFVGKAGQLLTRILKTMGFGRDDVYISNIVKYRPAVPGQRTNNRKPDAAEMAACLPFIMAEIDVVQPKAIVALGATAAVGLTGEESPVGRVRGRLRRWKNDIPLVVTYHPSYLLRNQALSERRKLWEDMLLVMEILGMPITPKHRGYFLNR